MEELARFGGRFRGLYLIEEFLYETDKHAHEKLFMLSAFLATHGANKEDIRDIYVLGHSMSPPDLEYFIFLMDVIWHLSYFKDSDRAWKETVLQELKCNRYELLPTIDACLEKFHT